MPASTPAPESPHAGGPPPGKKKLPAQKTPLRWQKPSCPAFTVPLWPRPSTQETYPPSPGPGSKKTRGCSQKIRSQLTRSSWPIRKYRRPAPEGSPPPQEGPPRRHLKMGHGPAWPQDAIWLSGLGSACTYCASAKAPFRDWPCIMRALLAHEITMLASRCVEL